VCIAGWATLASATALGRADTALSWNRLAATVAEQHRAVQGRVTVYALERWVAAPLAFALDRMGHRHVDVVLVDAPHTLTRGQFWLALRDTTWRWGQSPAMLLEQQGCHVGPEVSTRDSAQRIVLLPVDCPSQ
jgi:hypothetical protein